MKSVFLIGLILSGGWNCKRHNPATSNVSFDPLSTSTVATLLRIMSGRSQDPTMQRFNRGLEGTVNLPVDQNSWTGKYQDGTLKLAVDVPFGEGLFTDAKLQAQLELKIPERDKLLSPDDYGWCGQLGCSVRPVVGRVGIAVKAESGVGEEGVRLFGAGEINLPNVATVTFLAGKEQSASTAVDFGWAKQLMIRDEDFSKLLGAAQDQLDIEFIPDINSDLNSNILVGEFERSGGGKFFGWVKKDETAKPSIFQKAKVKKDAKVRPKFARLWSVEENILKNWPKLCGEDEPLN